MTDAARIAHEAFEQRWRDGDRWDIEGAELDGASHARQLKLLADYLPRPGLIDTYRDLFRNVGFRLAHEETLRGEKGGEDFSVLLSVFEKP